MMSHQLTPSPPSAAAVIYPLLDEGLRKPSLGAAQCSEAAAPATSAYARGDWPPRADHAVARRDGGEWPRLAASAPESEWQPKDGARPRGRPMRGDHRHAPYADGGQRCAGDAPAAASTTPTHVAQPGQQQADVRDYAVMEGPPGLSKLMLWHEEYAQPTSTHAQQQQLMMLHHHHQQQHHLQQQQQHHLQQQQQQHASTYLRDVLALPIFKQEESNLSSESDAKQPPFQYVLCAATSPAIKLHDETLTYLNQGQSYELRMLDNRKMGELPEINGKYVKSIVRVVFHDRRLQYTEHQQLESWKWNRPGDRILDIDMPMSVGIVDPRANPTLLNTVEFLWDPAKRSSVFIQVNCISTEFTPRKHGGEKGVPFRVQIDTFKQNDGGEYTEHLHSASCQVKVFKPKGADRKQKTDRDKMEKRTPLEKEKYQLSYDTTILTECSPWPDTTYLDNSPTTTTTTTTVTAVAATSSFQPATSSAAPTTFVNDSDCSSPNHQNEVSNNAILEQQKLSPTATIQEMQQWLHQHRFSSFSRLFSNFTGADLLKLSRDDLIQICGAADGIRLYNAVKARSVRPRLTMYVCQETQPPKKAAAQTQPSQAVTENGGPPHSAIYVYHAVFLEELTAAELQEKLATLFNISPRQIQHIYRQGPTGIHVLISDQMVQNIPDETCFILDTLKAENTEGYHIILK